MANQTPALAEELAKFSEYLHLLARLQIDSSLQGKIDLSGVVQQTLLEGCQAMVQLQGRSDSERAAWLRRALANNLADEIRKLKAGKRNVTRERSLNEALEQSSSRIEAWLVAEQSSPSHRLLAFERTAGLARALAQLPAQQRRAVELRHLQGLSLVDVANQLGCSKAAVVGLLHRGVKKLRELLKDDYGD